MKQQQRALFFFLRLFLAAGRSINHIVPGESAASFLGEFTSGKSRSAFILLRMLSKVSDICTNSGLSAGFSAQQALMRDPMFLGMSSTLGLRFWINDRRWNSYTIGSRKPTTFSIGQKHSYSMFGLQNGSMMKTVKGVCRDIPWLLHTPPWRCFVLWKEFCLSAAPKESLRNCRRPPYGCNASSIPNVQY